MRAQNCGSLITDSMDVSLSELRGLVMDREDWRAAIHGVAKSWTRLSTWTELNWTVCMCVCTCKSVWVVCAHMCVWVRESMWMCVCVYMWVCMNVIVYVCVCACFYREYRKAEESTHAAAHLGGCWMILSHRFKKMQVYSW